MVAAPYLQGVIRFVIPLLFLCWAGAQADDSPPKWLQEPGQIIEGPITPEMCIEAYWPNRSPDGYRISIYLPPIKPRTILLLEQGRREGWIVPRRCLSSDT